MASSASSLQLDPPPASWRPPGTRLNVAALPPLPPIHDSALLTRAFTQVTGLPFPSLTSDTVAVDYYQRDSLTYERLEFIGDGALAHFATELVARWFTDVTSGCLSQLKEMLVRNDTLAYLAWAYGFSPRIICIPGKTVPPHRVLQVHEQQDVLADVFEAYLSALVSEGNAEIWRCWLGKVYAEEVFPDLASAAHHFKERVLRSLENRYIGKRKADPIGSEPPTRESAIPPATVPGPDALLTWSDTFAQRVGNYSRMLYDGVVIAEGAGAKQVEARSAAMAAYVRAHLKS